MGFGPNILQETMEAKKDQRDYGLVLGRILIRPCARHKKKKSTADDEATGLLEEDIHSEHSKHKNAGSKKPSWRQVFSRQSNLILAAYGMMSMHQMAFDSLIPVFLHYPEQEMGGNPNVRLPLKFIGGFGVGRPQTSSGCRLKRSQSSRFPNDRHLLHSNRRNRHGCPISAIPNGS